ncbi:MAG: ABC transporter substrate-binding protein [Actinobacteria bacterium]|nr:ABC transporter substrate-binding protein [Actinomycetota bacterium]
MGMTGTRVNEKNKLESKRLAAVFIFACLVLCVVVTGCGKEAQVRKVKVGVLGSDARQLPYYIARDEGYFQESGVEVDGETVFGTGADLMSAMAAGEIDIGYVDVGSPLTFAAMGLADVEAIEQSTDGGSALAVKSGFEAGDIGGLVGQRVAVPGKATLEEFLLLKALKEAELTENEVEVVEVKPYDMVSYLSAGSIEAIMGFEPYPWTAEADGAGRVIMTADDIIKDVPSSLLVADSVFAGKNPVLISGLRTAHEKAIDFIHRNPLESADKGNLSMGTGREATRYMVENTDFRSEIDKKALKEYAVFLKETGVIDVDVDEFIDRFVND